MKIKDKLLLDDATLQGHSNLRSHDHMTLRYPMTFRILWNHVVLVKSAVYWSHIMIFENHFITHICDQHNQTCAVHSLSLCIVVPAPLDITGIDFWHIFLLADRDSRDSRIRVCSSASILHRISSWI